MNTIKTCLTAVFLSTGLATVLPVVSHADMTGEKGMMVDHMQEKEAPTAIDGYCPVCVIHGMAMKGNDNYVTTYKGKKYKFTGFEQQKVFIGDPENFVRDLDTKYQHMMKK